MHFSFTFSLILSCFIGQNALQFVRFDGLMSENGSLVFTPRLRLRAQAGLSSFLCSGTARRLVVRSEIMSRSCGVTRLQSLKRRLACAHARCHSCTCMDSAAHHQQLAVAAHFLFWIDFLTKDLFLIGHAYINLHQPANR